MQADYAEFVAELLDRAVNDLLLALKSSPSLCLAYLSRHRFPAATAPAKAQRLLPTTTIQEKKPFKALRVKKSQTILI